MDKKQLKIVCVSDTHSKHYKLLILEGDILIHAGDFSYRGLEKEVEDFCQWLDHQKFKHKIVIAGNHDMTLDQKMMQNSEKEKELCQKLKNRMKQSCTYLEHELVEVEGIKIFGSPYTPVFCRWGFEFKRGEEALKLWQKVPENIDILITHGPPFGILDTVDHSGQKVGCEELANEIKNRIKPKYHIFGHIHEEYGVRVNLD